MGGVRRAHPADEEHHGAREVGGSERGGWLELPSTSQRAVAGALAPTYWIGGTACAPHTFLHSAHYS